MPWPPSATPSTRRSEQESPDDGLTAVEMKAGARAAGVAGPRRPLLFAQSDALEPRRSRSYGRRLLPLKTTGGDVHQRDAAVATGGVVLRRPDPPRCADRTQRAIKDTGGQFADQLRPVGRD